MQMYTMTSLDITASRPHWAALGVACVEAYDTHLTGYEPTGTGELLVLALAAGKTGNDAVAWAVAERRRRYEADCLNHSLIKVGQGAAALARAIGTDAEREILLRLSGSLEHVVRRALGH